MNDIKPSKTTSQTGEKTSKKTEVPKTELSLKQDKEARNYIAIMCVIIGVIVVVGGYIIYRLAAQFTYISNVNRAQDMLITSLNTKQKNLTELKSNYEEIKTKGAGGVSDADRILSAMPITQAYDSLIATLEQIGQQSGVKVTSVTNASVGGGTSTQNSANTATSTTATTSTSQTNGIPFTFTVNVEGSYSGIIAFLEKTQQSARVINFNSMTVTGGSNGQLNASITMTTYYQPDADINSTFEPLK
jgi:Tfp pilus assembly protein PilO